MALFGFWEEALPYTDFIPTATLAWIFTVSGLRYAAKKKQRATLPSGLPRRGVQGPLLMERLTRNREPAREKRAARWFDDQWGYLDDDSQYLDDETLEKLSRGSTRDRSGNSLP